ncbi:formate-dependent uric acid utilization protein AegA [Pectobacterium parmentieri]|uniref:Glutamate synthase (NADPH), small subunit n=1 Tax=Pectobacterium parmentieri TaxID=1905730 RepID=A0A0H3ICI8_PECPM|nr:formate-dependent uric acid utilization protein AegA [Pectobacterium parmentieri]AFI92824.1 Glutamate synthase (NADPH), small subunit [Pectobacterium parmentieri]MBI0469580.1 oxidoreductase FeS-binding subunit [Pectobacterium parmentieri]MBI0493461.1 oxidoreductase FeS-binding subunit [Pectobacterium parmentieri]MBI0553318.1 oxidoreductase FeS-binding subunit [Pectobacterium parmentieri]MBI0567741.1 oxidoreductase FeS-binding subunit [Pectobacterium parmentieri]
MNRFVIASTQDCMGCHACEIACVISHNDERYPDSTTVFQPRIKAFNTPKLRAAVTCRHCEDAPCAGVCPTQALIRKDNSIQLVQEKCIGCKSCVLACPFGAMSMVTNPMNNSTIAHKCDLCADRPEGQACVEACPTQALQLVSEQTLATRRQEKQQVMAQRSAAHWQRETPVVKTLTLNPLSKRKNWPRRDAEKKPLAQRTTTFDEIYHGFSVQQTEDQADRCLSCGKRAICEWTCPLHNNIPELLSLAKQGRILEAVELSHQTSSLPEICGRVCPQDRLCEGACTLGKEYGAITIGNVERYITDTAMKMGWSPDMTHVVPSGKRAAIVGAGPAGLACADVLARNGVQAVVFDRHPEIGGLLTFGIPSFKLDKDVLIHRREVFSAMGIDFQLNTEVGKDISLAQLLDDYDTVFLGVGTYRSMKANIDNENAPGVFDALPFLIANTKHVMGLPELDDEPYISMAGKRVVVLGGGDTAMDCLRTSVRQGAISVTCAYRRDEANMPGSKKEVKNSREEGVEFMFNVQPQKICLNEQGEVCGISLVRTELGEPDASGRRRPRPIPGSEFVQPAEAVITAFGFQSHSMPWLEEADVDLDNWRYITAPLDSQIPCQTNHPRIFAGGDAVRGADLVVTAIADGRKAALGMIATMGLTAVTGALPAHPQRHEINAVREEVRT